jgi:hypothetical protein
MMQQAKPRQAYLGVFIIVGIFTILAIILVMVLGIFVVARQFGAVQADSLNPLLGFSPFNELDIDKIDPALALISLGGVPEADVILNAIAKDRPETALAGLLFQPQLTDKESAGGFLQLARVYAGQAAMSKAILSYQLACTIATLGPDMPDTARADIFLEAGEGLIDIQELSLAKFCLNQAFTIASKSPFLQAAHRRSIFERLQKNYIILDERVLARQSLSLSANPPRIALSLNEQTVLPEAEPVLLPAETQQAEAQRWQAAQELAVLLVERGGHAPQDAVDALAQALIAEDRLKLPYFKREAPNTTQLSKKIDIVLAQIAWLSIKYRVARQAYGISLVPEWESEAEQIRSDLTKSYEELFRLYADLIVGLPNVSQIDKATEERLRREILAGELGRYPNYPEQQRQKQLLEATNQLLTTQPELHVFIGVANVNNREMYTLIFTE